MKAKELPKIPKQGSWFCRHKLFHTTAVVVAFRGSLRTHNGQKINSNTFEEFWEVLSKIPGKQNTYNIAWIIAGKVKETIQTRASYQIVINKIKQMRASTHKLGTLVPIRCDQ